MAARNEGTDASAETLSDEVVAATLRSRCAALGIAVAHPSHRVGEVKRYLDNEAQAVQEGADGLHYRHPIERLS